MTAPQPVFHLLNAFAPHPHAGNQAAVVVFPSTAADDPRTNDEEYMKYLARDFGFSETAYVVPTEEEGRFGLRWWTPEVEINLCGHATLATAFVLFSHNPKLDHLNLDTRWSGTLTAKRISHQEVEIVLPSLAPSVLATFGHGSLDGEDKRRVAEVAEALGVSSDEILAVEEYGEDNNQSLIVELKGEVDLKNLQHIDHKALLGLSKGLTIVTQINPESKDKTLYLNSRVFASGLGIDEDPVTGSAHAYLTGYYLASPRSKSLSEPFRQNPADVVIEAKQLSHRGGELRCTWDNGNVKLVGKAFEWARGMLSVE
ncbi:hypothetical protein CI109_102480 [Kwoniella shandongensis]|uniref:Uncharacterized protein n=1 Tax=Kwoniella shandongensis TaxID=1734106 RepID=A0A5M6BZW5_9TREE|nr:uncharacterized protein CI109_003201 [Kwoniella shandongensis]KAA5528303.1 hypothetical protein CI109_003201 [Kwoniella shandongensis]